MTETEARRFLLVRAVEIEDSDGALLTREDRHQATAAGAAARGDRAFLARRSNFAFDRLSTRFPQVGRAERRAHWPAWIGWALPLAALIAGLLTNELGASSRLNIIAFPLLGTLAWNLVAYALLFAGLVRRLAARGDRPRAIWLERLTGCASRSSDPAGSQPALQAALARFAGDWLRYAAPLTRSRVRRALHLSAAALVIGVLAGMYWRALGVEYRAGWESTFIGPQTLDALLRVILAPASALTGIGLPGAEQLAALRWSAGAGENAGRWIHLYAATALLVVIGPRAVLAAIATACVWRLKRNLAVPGREDCHVRRLLREAHGEGASVRLIPYSFHPPARSLDTLRALLTDVFGSGTQLSADSPIPYGGEDAWLAGATFGPDTDQIILLFNSAATPEAETHGALVAGIGDALARRRSGTVLTLLLDETAHRERLAGQAGAAARLASRRAAWEKVLRHAGSTPVAVDFAQADRTALARRLEGALVRDPALVAGNAAR